MNKYISVIVVLCATNLYALEKSEAQNPFVISFLNQVNKVNRKTIHKLPCEYFQAVEQYVTITKAHCSLIDKSKLLSYEIELYYLLHNYHRFSPTTLLYRLRSAHQEMLKVLTDVNDERYQRYEQICSALLLQCAQVLFDSSYKQLLSTLDELDDRISYWHYQKIHPLSYCFSKSPVKWMIGKNQEKEISDNITILENKQAELYAIVGRLTAHTHAFAECDIQYTDCYVWIEELLSIVSCIKTDTEKVLDNTFFDFIAARLQVKIKHVDYLKYNSLYNIAHTKKSGYFVRNWIAHAVFVAASLYAARYYISNCTMVNQIIGDRCTSLYNSLDGWVIEPSYDVWKIVSGNLPEVDTKNSVVIDIKNDIETLEIKYGANKETSKNLNNYLKVDRANTQKTMKYLLDKWVQEKKEFVKGVDANGYNITYTIDEDYCNTVINSEYFGDTAPFQQLVHDMPKGVLNHLIRSDDFLDSVVVLAELKVYHYGSSLISIIFELIVDYGVPVVKEVLNVLARGNPELIAKINLIMNVAVLTPTVIFGWAGFSGLSKAYRWATARDYSPIRIALVEVNSLLIESSMSLDDYDYGKLIYLIHKLRNKVRLLKDPVGSEFLADISKLESKRFDSVAKRAIIDNMFNKYTVLGRIAL